MGRLASLRRACLGREREQLRRATDGPLPPDCKVLG